MKICFVALSLYPCLADDYSRKTIGGAEVQQAQIMHGLVKQGINVSAITEDFGQEESVKIDGITIYKTYLPGSGLPILRFLYPKIFSIYRALLRSNADIYYVRNASFLTTLVAFFCYYTGKKWVYAGAHDTDFTPGKELISNGRDRFLYRSGLRNASCIITQTKTQQKLLKCNYNLDCTVIYNFSNKDPIKPSQKGIFTILWVSTIRRWKRPEFFLYLAKKLPHFEFIMVGGADKANQAFYEEINTEATHIKNLKFLGFVPLQKTETFFDTASVFVNTSIKEGFPNTFLQAWRRGIPTVSFFDPDGVIDANHLGVKVNTLSEGVNAINQVHNEKNKRADNIRNYYINFHTDKIINDYIDLFQSLA